ncbi:hypothetical protein CYLTODRAFT_457687 [Cylindrobasidium torrendii FP15055 ss-10]|uniref:F-box domain-containing protein n=1 Tax=Cylindrobasidium torrendii FP15055 ss-10 TaxID=1314674 RepID=A0A0D7B316_9AGAR|nr:hypothetical protein CYLTODRAFT_457687 [Cylindrobasidium torrendii FP15055 ss-10]
MSNLHCIKCAAECVPSSDWLPERSDDLVRNLENNDAVPPDVHAQHRHDLDVLFMQRKNIDVQMTEIEALLAIWRERRNQVDDRIHDIQLAQSPLRSVPREILSSIFLLCMPSDFTCYRVFNTTPLPDTLDPKQPIWRLSKIWPPNTAVSFPRLYHLRLGIHNPHEMRLSPISIDAFRDSPHLSIYEQLGGPNIRINIPWHQLRRCFLVEPSSHCLDSFDNSNSLEVLAIRFSGGSFHFPPSGLKLPSLHTLAVDQLDAVMETLTSNVLRSVLAPRLSRLLLCGSDKLGDRMEATLPPYSSLNTDQVEDITLSWVFEVLPTARETFDTLFLRFNHLRTLYIESLDDAMVQFFNELEGCKDFLPCLQTLKVHSIQATHKALSKHLIAAVKVRAESGLTLLCLRPPPYHSSAVTARAGLEVAGGFYKPLLRALEGVIRIRFMTKGLLDSSPVFLSEWSA